MHFVTTNRKALCVKLNLHTPAAINGMYIGMVVPNSGTQFDYVSINRLWTLTCDNSYYVPDLHCVKYPSL